MLQLENIALRSWSQFATRIATKFHWSFNRFYYWRFIRAIIWSHLMREYQYYR